MLEVTYQPTRDEYIRMASRYYFGLPETKQAMQTKHVLVSIVLANVLIRTYGLWNTLVCMALAYIASEIYQRRSIEAFYSRIYKEREAKGGGDTTVRIEEERLSIEGPHVRTSADWSVVSLLSQDEIGFYIHYSQRQMVLIPRRAFDTPEQAQEFYTLAESYKNHAAEAAA